MLDGITAGTVAASKAVVVDSNKDAASFRNITLTGELDAGSLDVSGDADIDGTLETDALSINGTAVTSTAAELNILDGVTSTAAELNILDGVTASATDINLIDGITNGTVIASKAIITDANKDISGGRNITISGELDAATLDISGDADIDGTLEADAITIGGTTLAETISDTVGAMVSSNTETGITVTYEDGDNTLDFAIGTLNQDTTGTADNITVSANNSADETVYPIFVDGATGSQGAESDTGLTYNPSSGVLTSTSFTGNVTGNVTGNTSGTAATVTGAAQSNITSLGTLTTLTVDNVIVNGTTIGHTSDTDLITLADGNVTIAGELDLTTLDVSGDADIDGTLEADAITVGGTALASVIAGTTVSNATLASTVTVSDSTANTNFPVVFHDESNALLDDTGALRYNPSTGELLVPKLTVAGTTTTADTVTMQASNAIVFEGATADANETTLSIVDPTSDHTQYLVNQGGYIPVLAVATTTQISSTPEELNILDGATVVVGEINALDLGSTAVGTAIASKAVILDSNKDYTGLRNLTITGELDAATLDISGDVDIDGTLETDNLTVGGSQGSDGQVLTSTGSGVAWESASSGAVTAINNATANELVTIGSTTTELDAEANLTYDGTTFTVSGTGTGNLVELISTDAGASTAPDLSFYRNSSSPADDDNVGLIRFYGNDDGGNKTSYASIHAYIADASDGSSDGGLIFSTTVADTQAPTAATEKMRITETGNIGIGTASPSTLLHAKGGSGSSFIRIDNSADGYDTGFEIYQNGSRKWEIHSDDSQSDALQLRPGGNSYYEFGATGELKVGMGNIADPKVIIDSASGGDPLLRFDTGAANRNAFIDFHDEGTQAGGIEYAHNGNSMRFSVASNNRTESLRISSTGQLLLGATAAVDSEQALINRNGSCKMTIRAEEDSSARDALFSLHTRNTGAQCRINFVDGAGAGSGPGQIYYNHDGNSLTFITGSTENAVLDSSGNFTIQGSYSPSDGRLKENIEDFSYDIKKFKAYSPKTFDWINPEEHGGKTQQIGFIAQEQEVIDSRFIEEVETDADRKDTKLLDTITKKDGDIKGISKTSEFVQKDAMYISIIQQLITRLETAEEKIAALEGGS
jgi:cytoskeletal protein CcmA (bactofilin family)